MLASEVPAFLTVTCLRDGEFHSLGYASHTGDSMLSFLDHESFLEPLLANQSVTAVLVTPALAGSLPSHLAVLESQNPKEDFYDLHTHLTRNTFFYGEPAPTEVAADAYIHPSAVIAPVGVRIGSGVVIEPHVTVHTGTVIESHCIIRSGTTLGGEGFLFRRRPSGIVGIPHSGGVWLCPEVEIQHNCVVDKAIFGRHTSLGRQTKLDNFVHVAHDTRIGERCLLAAGAVLAGSVNVGDDVWIGPGAVISNFVQLGNGAFVSLGTVATRAVEPGQKVIGRALGFTVQAK